MFAKNEIIDYLCSMDSPRTLFARVVNYLREESQLSPRRYCTIFAKVVSKGAYKIEETDL